MWAVPGLHVASHLPRMKISITDSTTLAFREGRAAAVEEAVSATLNSTVSSGISGANCNTGTLNTVNRLCCCCEPWKLFPGVGYQSKGEAWVAGGSGMLLRTTGGGKVMGP